MVVEQYVTEVFAHEKITLDATTAKTLDATKYAPSGAVRAKKALITIETAAVRVYRDGTVPTSSDGVPVAAGTSFIVYGDDIKNFRIIGQTGSPVAWVEYGR